MSGARRSAVGPQPTPAAARRLPHGHLTAWPGRYHGDMANGVSDIGRVLLLVGGFLLVVGLVLTLGGRIGFGRLPGDIVYRKGNFTFYFPLVTCLLLTALFALFRR
jgi:DUF2905 family protein